MRLNDGRDTGGTAELLDGLRALFEPGAHHTIAQRRKDRLMRDDEGEGAPPYGPVDLDARVVVVRRPPPTHPSDDRGRNLARLPQPPGV